MIEHQRAEREERRAESKRERRSERRTGMTRKKLCRKPQHEHDTERGCQADRQRGAEPRIHAHHPPVVGIAAEPSLDVIEHKVRRHREQRGTRRLVRMKVPVRRDADIAGAGAFADDHHRRSGIERRVVHGELLPLGFRSRADIPPVAPRELMPHSVERELAVFDVRTHELPPFSGVIDHVVVNREPALLHKRAHLGKARILIPPAALVEPCEGDERQGEQQQLEAAGRHCGNDE